MSEAEALFSGEGFTLPELYILAVSNHNRNERVITSFQAIK